MIMSHVLWVLIEWSYMLELHPILLRPSLMFDSAFLDLLLLGISCTFDFFLPLCTLSLFRTACTCSSTVHTRTIINGACCTINCTLRLQILAAIINSMLMKILGFGRFSNFDRYNINQFLHYSLNFLKWPHIRTYLLKTTGTSHQDGSNTVMLIAVDQLVSNSGRAYSAYYTFIAHCF